MALSVLSRHILLCFLALILAVSATKWLDVLRVFVFFFFFKERPPLVSYFLPGRARLPQRERTRHLKCSRQVRQAVVRHPSISRGEDTRVCVSVSSKLLSGAGDRCVPDCWGAPRLKSGPLASGGALNPLSSSLRPPSPGAGASDIRGGGKGDEKELPSPVKRGRGEGRGYTHRNAIFRSPLLRSRPRLPRAGMRNAPLWKMAPITSLTPADLCCWPPTSYKHDRRHHPPFPSVAMPQPFPPSAHTHTQTRARDAHRAPFFTSRRGLLD